ncbi:hypothetical protein OUZ56_018552 [Daphnia magna]|uniref:Uncharacterized protein n=1 Tax=Daphnia magna TaxID=35525 RepID=A0ABQ9Z955_9CRUS|nr:hypothetical protein OUZ56_018552 [Daphnia magna]
MAVESTVNGGKFSMMATIIRVNFDWPTMLNAVVRNDDDFNNAAACWCVVSVHHSVLRLGRVEVSLRPVLRTVRVGPAYQVPEEGI